MTRGIGRTPEIEAARRAKIRESRMGEKNHNYGKHPSEETKDRMHMAHLGRTSPNKGRIWPEEIKAKFSAAHMGHKHTEETKQKCRLINLGRVVSEETRAKIGAASKGRHLSDEAKAKVSAASKGRKRSPESIAKVVAAHKGSHRSEEAKAKMRLAYLNGKRAPGNQKVIMTKAGVMVRSGWEAKVCDILTDFKIAWEYEPQAFDLGKLGTYTPDLYLNESGYWIEVKGYWRSKSKAKYEKFAKTHKILLIAKLQYNVISKHPYLLKDWIEGTVKPLHNHTWQYKLIEEV